MLTRRGRRAAVVALAAALTTVGPTAQAAGGGSVKCNVTTGRCRVVVATTPPDVTVIPGTLIGHVHPKKQRAASRATAPTQRAPATPALDAAADHHASTYCATARLTGTVPPECIPAPATPGQSQAGPAVTAQQAAERAIARLALPAPVIGSAPCRGCGTFVGLPLWLWTQAWTPQTATATAGPYTVTATARPTQIVWDLGDGSPAFACFDAGKPYVEAYGFARPYCGGYYERKGDFVLTGTWTWEVTWTGATSGSRTMTTRASMPVNVAESQVIITTNK